MNTGGVCAQGQEDAVFLEIPPILKVLLWSGAATLMIVSAGLYVIFSSFAKSQFEFVFALCAVAFFLALAAGCVRQAVVAFNRANPEEAVIPSSAARLVSLMVAPASFRSSKVASRALLVAA